MAGRRSDSTISPAVGGATPIRLLGVLSIRAGLLLGVPSLLVLLGCLPALAAGSVPVTAERAVAAATGSVATPSRVETAFYVASLGLLASCWLLGLGLLVEGVLEDSDDGPA